MCDICGRHIILREFQFHEEQCLKALTIADETNLTNPEKKIKKKKTNEEEFFSISSDEDYYMPDIEEEETKTFSTNNNDDKKYETRAKPITRKNEKNDKNSEKTKAAPKERVFFFLKLTLFFPS